MGGVDPSGRWSEGARGPAAPPGASVPSTRPTSAPAVRLHRLLPTSEPLGKPQPPRVPAQLDHLGPCAACGHRAFSYGALGRLRPPGWRSWDPFVFAGESNFAVAPDRLF